MTSEELEKDRDKYIKLKIKLTSIANSLKSFNTNVVNIKPKIVNNYSVNNESTPIVNRIVKLGNSSNQIRNHLVKTIIPAIDAEIKKCNVQITKLQAAEKAAATAAKAAAAKAKAASVTSING